MKRQGHKSTSNSSNGQRGQKVRTSPTNTSLLPPCKVCQQQAAGFHYGVNTCEACKGFFRRSLIREEPYKCLGKGNCNIRAGKRKICPQCRYLKCLAVGMSRDNIKTGRYTHAKRTQDTLEYYQTLGKSLYHHDNDNDNNNNNNNGNSENQTMNTLLFDSLLSEVGHSIPDMPPAYDAISPMDIDTWNMLESKTQLSPLSPSSTEQLRTFLEASPAEMPSLQPLQELSLSDGFRSEEGNRHSLGLPSFSSLCKSSARKTVADLPSSNETFCEVKNPLPSSIHDLILPDSSLSEGMEDRKPSLPLTECVELFSHGVETDPEAEVTCSSGKDPDVLDDVQCEKLVNQVMQTHQKLIISFCDNLTEEAMKKKQQDCHENCKLKRAVFGSMDLTETEYQDIYRKTGLDADNRQPIISRLMQRVEDNIYRYIEFVKTIPGFLELSTNDQIRLIRDNRSEFGILCHYWGYNDDLKVVTFPFGPTLCIHELAKVWGRDLFLHRFQCARLLQQLGLTKEETVMVKCLMVVTVGRQDVEEPERVSAVQWKMAQCLMWTLRQSRPNPDRFYARIISAVCQLRYLCQTFYNWLKTNPFQDYSQVQSSSLLAEWFSEDFEMS